MPREELAHLLAPGAGFGAAASSVLLGARCRSGPAADAGLWIALLEPDTEGRLARVAGPLRRGLGGDLDPRGAVRHGHPGRCPPRGRVRSDPSVCVLGGGLAGPHRLVVEAVPSPP